MANEEFERRDVEKPELKTKITNNDNSIGQIAGYAIKFNKPSTNKGPFTEFISPHALDNTDMSDVLALYNHNNENILGRSAAGTLKLKIDDVGLYFTIDLPDSSVAKDVYANIKAGNLRGMSFGFKVAKGGDEWKYNQIKPIRIINSISKFNEISVVSVPAYDDTSVLVTRSLDAFLLGEKEQIYRAKIKELLR